MLLNPQVRGERRRELQRELGLAAAFIEWGRDWIRRARERDPSAPPVKAVIYAPNGEVLREVEVPPENP